MSKEKILKNLKKRLSKWQLSDEALEQIATMIEEEVSKKIPS